MDSDRHTNTLSSCRESIRCSRDTYPESYITKFTSIRRKSGPYNLNAACLESLDGVDDVEGAQRHVLDARPAVEINVLLNLFRGGLVFKAHRLCVSLNSRFESNNKEEESAHVQRGFRNCGQPRETVFYCRKTSASTASRTPRRTWATHRNEIMNDGSYSGDCWRLCQKLQNHAESGRKWMMSRVRMHPRPAVQVNVLMDMYGESDSV